MQFLPAQLAQPERYCRFAAGRLRARVRSRVECAAASASGIPVHDLAHTSLKSRAARAVSSHRRRAVDLDALEVAIETPGPADRTVLARDELVRRLQARARPLAACAARRNRHPWGKDRGVRLAAKSSSASSASPKRTVSEHLAKVCARLPTFHYSEPVALRRTK